MPKMNIFEAMALSEHIDDKLMGYPPRSKEAMDRKKSYFANLRGGKGFTVPKEQPRVHGNGKTRGEMKREARAAFLDRIKYEQDKVHFARQGRGIIHVNRMLEMGQLK